MQIQNNRNVNFQGFGIEGVVRAKAVKNFLENKNNLELLNKLDSKNVDVFMTSKGKELRFIRKPYGDLGKYGVETVSTEKFSEISSKESIFEEFMGKISNALKKGENDFVKKQ